MRVGAARLITSITFATLMLGSQGTSERRPSATPAAPILAATEEGVRYGYLRAGSSGPSPTLFVFALSLEASLTHYLDLVGHAGKLAARNLWIVIGDQDERVSTQRAMELALAVSRASVSQRTGTRLQFHLEAAEGHRVPEGAYRRAAQWLLRQASQNKEEQVNER